jgi:hypothetical protein
MTFGGCEPIISCRTGMTQMKNRNPIRRAAAKRRRASPRKSTKVHGGIKNRHPAFGAMKGLTRIMPGTDLTQPADPDWGKVWDEKP